LAWDSPLSALEEIFTTCAELDDAAVASGASGEGHLQVVRLVVAMPLELQTRTSSEGDVELRVAPPRQAMATSVMPVLHQLRLVVEVQR